MDELIRIKSWTIKFSEREMKEIRFAQLYARDYDHGTAGHNRLVVIAKMADMLDQDDQSDGD